MERAMIDALTRAKAAPGLSPGALTAALALALAEAANGIVINADSAQIYRDLPVLSAAPTEEDRRG